MHKEQLKKKKCYLSIDYYSCKGVYTMYFCFETLQFIYFTLLGEQDEA